MAISIVFLLSFIFFSLIVWVWKLRETKPGPPGPIGLPIVGHLPFLGSDPSTKLMEWREKYGPIFQIYFGSFRTVVISDIKLLSEAFNMDAMCGRPETQTHTIPTNRKGLAFSEYEDSREQRRFILKALKDFGVTGSKFAAEIQKEVAGFIRNLENKTGEPMEVKKLFNLHLLNSVWNCVSSTKLSDNDHDQRVLRASARIAALPGIMAQLGVFIPWFGSLFPNLTEITSAVQAYEDLYSFLDERIEKHRETWVQGKPRDVVDAYLDKMETTTDRNSTFSPAKNFLRATLADLFIASSDTTSATLEFALQYLIMYPEIQRNLQNEIRAVFPTPGFPNLQDRHLLPYTEAVINEILRFSSIVPTGLFHNTTSDVLFHDYVIPKDTMILSDLHGINHSKKIWRDPDVFRPERFLGQDGQRNRKLIQTFSVGRRVCPGERIAREQIFMFITGIFKKFHISFAPGSMPSLNGVFGIARHPEPFQVIFSLRN